MTSRIFAARVAFRSYPYSMRICRTSACRTWPCCAEIHRHRLIPGIDLKHYQTAMADLMSGAMLAENRGLFDKRLSA